MNSSTPDSHDSNPQPLTRRRFIQRTAAASAITAFGASIVLAEGPLRPPTVNVLMSITYTRIEAGGHIVTAAPVIPIQDSPTEGRPHDGEEITAQVETHLNSLVNKGKWTKVEDWQEKPYGKEADTTGCPQIFGNPPLTAQLHVNEAGQTDGTYDWWIPNEDPLGGNGQPDPNGHMTIQIVLCNGFI